LACLFVVVVPTLVFGREYLQLRLPEISFSEVDVSAWVQEKFKLGSPPKSQYKETISSGPNDVGIETTIPGSAYTQGITVLDNLYLRNGTLFVLTVDQSKFPSKAEMMGEPIVRLDLDSAAQDLQFLHPSTKILGQRAIRISGLSVIVLDRPSVMNNFYSWWAEIVLRAWRIYSKLTAEQRYLPIPSRFILPAVAHGEWRDDSKLTGPLMRVGFPSTAIEQSDYWRDLINLNATVIFDRVILISREAATKNSNAGFWSQPSKGARQSEVPSGFWEPIRQSVVQNTLGCLPDNRDVILGKVRVGGHSTKPLVTYIVNQHATPRLNDNDHKALIDALRALERSKVCDFHVLDMERASLEEQIEYVSKSTILVGVHGIGLTHQLWMPPSPRSTLLEIIWPNASYAYDHRVIAGILGHKHYIVWNDTLLASPEGSYDKVVQNNDLAEELYSDVIPVYGPAVARLIKDRLSL